MTTVSGHARPDSFDRALSLLREPNAVAPAGGTTVNARPGTEPVSVPDLLAPALDGAGWPADGHVRGPADHRRAVGRVPMARVGEEIAR